MSTQGPVLRGGRAVSGLVPAVEHALPLRMLLYVIIFLAAGWPLILFLMGSAWTLNEPLSGNAIGIGWRVWLAWCILAVTGVVGAVHGSHPDARQARCNAAAAGFFMGLICLNDMGSDGEVLARLNQYRADYHYTMPLTTERSVLPGDLYYGYLTPHARVKRVNFRNLDGALGKIGTPCLDVHLGLLGGYFATPPYECGTRPGRRMASREDLMLAAQPQ